MHGPDALGHAVRFPHHFCGLGAQLCAIRSRLTHALLLARSAHHTSQPNKRGSPTSAASHGCWVEARGTQSAAPSAKGS